MPDFWSLSIGSNKLSNIILSYKEVLMKNEGLTTRKLKCRNQKDKNEMIKILALNTMVLNLKSYICHVNTACEHSLICSKEFRF